MGLSISEFGALTPREIEIELEAVREKAREEASEEEFRLRLFDAHMATLEMLVHNANFKRALKVSDFKLLRDKKRVNVSEETLAFDARIRAEAQAKLREKQKMKGISWR